MASYGCSNEALEWFQLIANGFNELIVFMWYRISELWPFCFFVDLLPILTEDKSHIFSNEMQINFLSLSFCFS